MKLEDVQQKIDSYLDSISGEELLQTLTDKYGMSEYDMNDSDAIPDEPTVGNAMIALDQAGYWFFRKKDQSPVPVIYRQK